MRRLLPLRLAVPLFLIVVPAYTMLLAQSEKPAWLKPRPPKSQQVVAPFWTLEPGWHTELEIRNNLAEREIAVTPVLRTFQGVEVELPSMTLVANEVKSVDLREAVEAVAPHLLDASNSYGSVVFRYSSAGFSNIYASVMVHRDGHPISFHFDAQPLVASFASGSRESIWWLPRGTSDGFLVVSNFSDQPVIGQQVLTAADGTQRDAQPIALGPRQTRRVSLREAVQRAGFAGLYGGLSVSFASGAGSVYVTVLSFDETTGFSAIMKIFESNPTAKAELITLRAAMVALAAPDPTLDFPAGTVLQPVVFLRNASPTQLAPELLLSWRSESAQGMVPVSLTALAPGETRTVDIAALQQDETIPPSANWATVNITYNGREGDIVPVAASYDSAGRYGLQSPFSSGLASVWKGGMWHVDSQHNTLITTGNGGTKSAKVAVTLRYGQDGVYELPERRLAPGEQLWLEVGELIRNQVPDKKGRTLPPDAAAGSYEIADLDDPDIGYLYEGKLIIDKTFGHASYGCAACCAIYATWMGPNPWSNFAGFTGPDDVFSENCIGSVANRTGASYGWSSSNTAVATIPGVGSVYGVEAGSSNVGSFLSGRIEGVNNCPLSAFSQGALVRVANLKCIPGTVTRGGTMTCTASGGGSYSEWKFSDGTNTVTRATNTTSSTWSGIVVTGGSVSVKVTTPSGTQVIVTRTIAVNARSQFAFTAVTPTKQANPYVHPGNCSMSVPTLPAAGNTVGFACLDQYFSRAAAQVADNGQNHGFWYVQSASNAGSSLPTTFNYITAGYLDNAAGEFAQKQCGNYNPVTDTGYISHAQLLSNTLEHESGTTRGHYAQYKATQDSSTNNVGVAIEKEVGAPSVTQTQFLNQVDSVAVAKGGAIATATSVDDCNVDVTKDTSCTFRGYINWPPYATCP